MKSLTASNEQSNSGANSGYTGTETQMDYIVHWLNRHAERKRAKAEADSRKEA